MIARLRGNIHPLDTGRVLLDVNGVGYEVFVPAKGIESLVAGSSASLEIHTHVTDDSIRLFGFVNRDEKAIFERLLSVSGVGPKLALGVLSGLAAPELANSIVQGDVKRLSSLPGIGKKTAERIILELKDKLAKTIEAPQAKASVAGSQQAEEDAVAALLHLGYRRTEAVDAIGQALRDNPSLLDDPGILVKEALRGLAKV